jgi:hypothetical protein
VSSEDHPAVCRAVMDAFALSPCGSIVIGPDQVFWDFRRGDQFLGLDWDNWMGFMVYAKTTDSEQLVRDIAEWLSASHWANTGTQPG